MEFPASLRQALENRAASFPSLAQDAQALSLRYRADYQDGRRLLTTDSEAAAYAAARMPATFGAAAFALEQALEASGLSPVSLLDAGAGTGAASWASDALLPLESAVCLEREPAMIRLGKALMKDGSPALQQARWLQGDLTRELPCRAELVIASYVLGELSDQERSSAALRLWQAADSLLLLLEPGTPAGFARLKALRGLLMSQGAYIAAPCPCQGDCLLPEEDWCHFGCRVARSRLHKQLKGGDAPFEDEKFAYLALCRHAPSPGAGRILRRPYIEPGTITLRLCTPAGLEARTIRKKDPRFKEVRKADWGKRF